MTKMHQLLYSFSPFTPGAETILSLNRRLEKQWTLFVSSFTSNQVIVISPSIQGYLAFVCNSFPIGP